MLPPLLPAGAHTQEPHPVPAPNHYKNLKPISFPCSVKLLLDLFLKPALPSLQSLLGLCWGWGGVSSLNILGGGPSSSRGGAT